MKIQTPKMLRMSTYVTARPGKNPELLPGACLYAEPASLREVLLAETTDDVRVLSEPLVLTTGEEISEARWGTPAGAKTLNHSAVVIAPARLMVTGYDPEQAEALLVSVLGRSQGKIYQSGAFFLEDVLRELGDALN